MANKRSRSQFENELQKKESPYAFFGTPLPPLDSDARDDGSYVPVWQQEVRDERGRKRLHGAFTGGFSAGYFNTVGSKEGWAPQTFVSSRTNRAKAQQRPEDFMDEEDIADAEDAKRVQTASGYSGLGGTAEDGSRGDMLMDLVRPASEDSMGIKLLQKMGWRPGQGVGPKVRRKARLDEAAGEGADDSETHLFAPSNSKMIGFVRKNDSKGLGYAGELGLSRPIQEEKNDDEDGESPLVLVRKPKKPKAKAKKASFGVGILNDTGSDDEDPYDMGPRLSYNRTIGGDKKTKKKPTGGANPLLGARPVFTKKSTTSTSAGFRKCHDGRLPLDGFVLSLKALSLSSANKYAPPKVPDTWKSKMDTSTSSAKEEYKSTADAAKASTLDPKARASMLGEEALPGKSVFDFISPAARDKLAAASGRKDLPQGLGENAPEGYRMSAEAKQKELWSSIPSLSKVVALEALQRGINGWMPYAEDEKKRARYRVFLEIKAGLRGDMLPERPPGFTMDDWRNEMSEFAQAAEVFRPMTGAMASRFTSSSQTFEGSHNAGEKETEMPLLSRPAAKAEDPAEKAAKMGMFGVMTRSEVPFHPTRLLCKRFGVSAPAVVDPGDGVGGEGGAASTVPEVLPKRAIERMMQDAAIRRFTSAGTEGGNTTTEQQGAPVSMPEMPKQAVVDAERNEALEAERPGDAVFKAIFGSDDEEDDD